MNAKVLIPLFAGMFAIGWFLPDAMPTAAQKEVNARDKNQNNDEGSVQSRNKKYYSVEDEYEAESDTEEVILNRKRDGHFYAQATVDGADVNFLVDTGASAIALTASDAEAIGLDWEDEEAQLVGRGVSGDVYGHRVTLNEVEVGGFIVRDLEAAIIPTGLDRSLLGQSFLSKIDNVNISGDKMTLQ